MKKLLLKVPIGLIWLRLIAGFIIILLSVSQIRYNRLLITGIIVLALLSDIFDGIIARQLKISTQKLRRLDSTVDQVFWTCTLIGSFLLCRSFLIDSYKKILVLLIFEALTYLISFLRFKKEVATHAFLSKLWTLTIFAAFIQIVLTCKSGILFNFCIYFGIFTRIEIIAILLIIKEWTTDVPSVFHAILLRQGREIKKNKLLNG